MDNKTAERQWKNDPVSIITSKIEELRAQGQKTVTSTELANWLYHDYGVTSVGTNGGAKTIGKILGDQGLTKFGGNYLL